MTSEAKGGAELELVPLDCPSCGAAVEAHGEDVVYYCTACRNGYAFEAESRSLAPVEVRFVSAPSVAVDSYLPFWVLPAEVRVHRREAGGGGFSGLMSFFLGSDRRPGEPVGSGRFVVPAFHCSLEAVTALSRAYTERSTDLDERLGERLVGGRYGVGDARKLAHYALIASEVGQPDTLRRLEYEIDFGEPTLLGVPFVRRGEGLADAHFGISL